MKNNPMAGNKLSVEYILIPTDSNELASNTKKAHFRQFNKNNIARKSIAVSITKNEFSIDESSLRITSLLMSESRFDFTMKKSASRKSIR